MNYSFKEVENQLKEKNELYGSGLSSLKFIVDAQLPKKLADYLNGKGYEAIHTPDLPNKNATTDKFIKEKSAAEGLILITKDDDFLRSFMIEKKPFKLVLVRTGNISNKYLMEIFEKGISFITFLIDHHSMIEITKEEIIVHD